MNNEERNYKVYRHTNLINGKMYKRLVKFNLGENVLKLIEKK